MNQHRPALVANGTARFSQDIVHESLVYTNIIYTNTYIHTYIANIRAYPWTPVSLLMGMPYRSSIIAGYGCKRVLARNDQVPIMGCVFEKSNFLSKRVQNVYCGHSKEPSRETALLSIRNKW